MDINSLELPSAIWSRLRGCREWGDVFSMVRGNSSGPLYVVGGRVYRAAIEAIHKYDAGFKDVDWDFFAEGELCAPYRAAVQPGWLAARGSYRGNFSLRFTQGSALGTYPTPIGFQIRPIVEGAKVDLISAKDFGTPGCIQDYFDKVPLQIQAIALDISSRRLFGPGLADIAARTLRPNNTDSVVNFPTYLATKAASLKFSTEGTSEAKVPCDCFGRDIIALMNNGCQRKDMHR